MSLREKAKLVRIHICESDKLDGAPLYEAIVRMCRESGIRGATVFRGLEGFGETAEFHTGHRIAADQPIVVVIVDSDENIARILPAIEDVVNTGMIAASTVETRRIGNDTLRGE